MTNSNRQREKFLKIELLAVLAVGVIVAVAGYDLFVSSEPENPFLRSGAEVIPSAAGSARSQCETPFRTMTPETESISIQPAE